MEKAPRDSRGRFVSPWNPRRRPPLAVLRWFLSPNPFRHQKHPVCFPVKRPDLDSLESSGRDYLVWLGHSTVYLRLSGVRVLTDPVFGDVWPPFIRRKTPLSVDPDRLPGVDLVLLSHSHYDHLNNRSITRIIKRYDPRFVTGPGYERYLARRGTDKNIVLDWGESRHERGLKITALPVQHWSRRGTFDADRMLWSSFLLASRERKVYWIGDTGYDGGVFKKTGAETGPVDILLCPIGSYEPRWFMEMYHVNPEEALALARDVGARVMIPIHWGTFNLTDEPLWLPVKRLDELVGNGENGEVKVEVLEHGGSRPL